MTRGLALLLTSALFVLSASCGGNSGGSTGPAPVASVSISPKPDTLIVGTTKQLATVEQDASGHPINGRVVTWLSMDTSVATITQQGLVSAQGLGATHVIATSEGKDDSAAIVVLPIPVASVLISPAVDSLNVGDTVTLTVVLKDSLGRTLAPRPVTWATTDTFTVLVSSAGQARVVGAGAALVSATAGGHSGSASFTGLVKFTSVAAGYEHTCAIAGDSTAYCWGTNDHGQLGHGDNAATTFPVRVAGSHKFVAISASGNGIDAHSCGIAEASIAYCWGNNQDGQLGDGTTNDAPTPVAVSGAYTWTAVSVGAFFSCGLVSGGAAYCWGYDAEGSLGDSGGADSHVPLAVPGGLKFSSIVAGNSDVCALTAAGKAYCWGPGLSGALGDSSTALGPFKPTPVVGGLTFTQLSASVGYTVCGTTSAGQAFCWGDGGAGQLGDSLFVGSDYPVSVDGGLTFSSVSAGTEPVCGITASGAYCWGDFALGTVTPSQSSVPVQVSGGLSFLSISAGFEHACGVTTGFVLYCWGGDGRFGQLGVGDVTKRPTPTRVLFQP